LAAGIASGATAEAGITAEAASAGIAAGAGIVSGAGAGLSQAAKVKAKRAETRAVRNIIKSLIERLKKFLKLIRRRNDYFERPSILTTIFKISSTECIFMKIFCWKAIKTQGRNF
jgi:hypothetical protein